MSTPRKDQVEQLTDEEIEVIRTVAEMDVPIAEDAKRIRDAIEEVRR